ncbi:MAG: Verru Chthon cassette protein [Phycisphaerales bacterium]|nr:Verru Chthon cassette protein [Phycisphaerales bacterium]
MNTARPTNTPRRRRPPAARRPAFTLNELLVVIAIAVLVVALAVPAFNVITNSRSVDGAENQMSAYVATARLEAIGLQEPRGVIFFEDQVTGRVTLAQVYHPPAAADPLVDIDLYPNRDEMVLPNGVGCQEVPGTPGAATQVFPWRPWGVVMFDRTGALTTDNVRIPTAGTNALRDRIVKVKDKDGNDVVLKSTEQLVPATIGFALFDAKAYAEIGPANRKTWLNDNASPYLVNRYNGTLLKGQ